MKNLLAVFALLMSTNALSTQIVEWNKRPIQVVLSVGQERIIELQDNVFVGVPSNIKDLLRVQSAQGFVYLTALEQFPKSRIQLKLNKTGEIIILDVGTTIEKTTSENIIIKHLKDAPKKGQSDTGHSIGNKSLSATPVQLTKYAARMFYAPERLAVKDARIRMSRAPNVNLNGLFVGKSFNLFDAQALAVFRTGNLYLTAIKLNNRTAQEQTIYFEDINADFLYATPQHLRVNAKDNSGEMTMLYLITSQPLEASLYLSPQPYVYGE